MKVLFIENAGNMNAGAFHSLLALTLLLKEKGVEITIVIPDRADGLNLLRDSDINIIKMRECSYSWMIKRNADCREKLKMPIKDVVVRKAARKLARYIKNNNIDIVHENTSACYIGAYAAQIADIPHIWHIREFMEEDFNTTIWCKKRALKLMNESEAVIAVSDAIKSKYSGKICPNILCRIYDGIETEYFYSPFRRIFIGKDIRLLCAGRIGEGKGQYDLIKAIGFLKSKYHIALKVYFAGTYDALTMEKCKSLASQLDISDHLEFLGQAKNMKNLYEDSDIFCMCSKSEAFGRVTVEAMLAGCLVIGSNSGGTPEVLGSGKYGLLYNPGDIEDLAEKIHYAINNKNDMELLAFKGREHAKDYFSAKKNADAIFKLYTDLTNGDNRNISYGKR